jgi:hypothetical protein
MKTLKQFLKLLFVIVAPLVATIYYATNITEIFSSRPLIICAYTFALMLVLFNAVFYSFHMSNTKLWKRFKVYLVPGFGFLIANDNPTVLILIGFVAIEFDYTGLCRKKKPRFNLKKENKF